MLSDINPENLLIFDIETVPGKASYHECSEVVQKLFEDKVGRLRKPEEDVAEFYFSRAGIYAEFGKIICIACAYLQKKDNQYQMKVKVIKGHDEKELLTEFSQTLLNVSKNNFCLCGHNIREFDVPWLCRRMIIHSMTLPPVLDIYGKKPWEVNHVDTLDLWKFGDYKHYTSLHLLASLLGIPTPKDDIDGSMVGSVYYKEDGLERIATYCGKDVITVAQLIMRMKGMELIREENIQFA